jgi:hypothetical protein
MKKWLIIIITSVFLLISCNAFSADEQDTLIQQNPAPTSCNVYIIYPKQTLKPSCSIFINGLLETCLKNGTYICCSVLPGKTRVAQYGMTYSEIVLDTEPGKDYYIKIKLRMPLNPMTGSLLYCNFTVIDETEGKTLLSEYPVVDWSDSATAP